VEASPHILAALGVVRGGCEHRLRPSVLCLKASLVKLPDRDAKAAWVAAHLVERDQPVETVKGGVLQPLGHRWPGELLEAHHQFGLERAPGA
jgi:hypothetical protein